MNCRLAAVPLQSLTLHLHSSLLESVSAFPVSCDNARLERQPCWGFLWNVKPPALESRRTSESSTCALSLWLAVVGWQCIESAECHGGCRKEPILPFGNRIYKACSICLFTRCVRRTSISSDVVPCFPVCPAPVREAPKSGLGGSARRDQEYFVTRFEIE